MNQKLAYALCLGGIVVTCYLVQEIIGDAQNWQALTTPQAVSHGARILGGVALSVAGAIGIDLSTLTKNVRGFLDRDKGPTQ